MIDNFSLGLTHVLMLIAAVLLLRRPDLDKEPGPHGPEPRKRARREPRQRQDGEPRPRWGKSTTAPPEHPFDA